MKQRDIDALYSVNKLIGLEKERHAAEIKRLEEAKGNIRSQCDHKYADGETAWQVGFMANTCLICFESDL